MKPNFSHIPRSLHSLAKERWRNKDSSGLLSLAPHQNRGELLIDNLEQLISRGMYEEALYATYTHGPHFDTQFWRFLFEKADRKKLAAFGEPIPNKPIKVYRGISDAMHLKWIRGLSWSLNPNLAAWFATRYARRGKPAVFSLLVDPQSILMITNDRREEEVIVATWKCGTAKRVIPMPEARNDQAALPVISEYSPEG